MNVMFPGNLRAAPPRDNLQFLPPARFDVRGGSGREPVSDINGFATDPRQQTATVAARGALLPVLYGNRDVPGLVFAVGTISTDLVIGYIWCIGPVESIDALYINDAAVPGGVTVTHYTGTPTQTADTTLQTAIAGYNDSLRFQTPTGLRGIAYTVLRIPTGVLDGFPRARAVVRGLNNIRDPRADNALGYTANSALCLANYIEDAVFGLGRPVVAGLEDCADWCDSLLGDTEPRARLALLLSQGRRAEDYVRLLAEYAEAFYVPEGNGYRLIPDAPVDLGSAPVITASDIITGSLAIQARGELDIPTEIEVQYTEPPDPLSDPWSMTTIEPIALPGVPTGEVSRIPTSVSLEGVTRYEEAANKAQMRLSRAQQPCTVSWTARDIGVRFQRGDVVRVEHPQRGASVPCRIMGIRHAGPGRYSITADRYDPAHYPNDIQLPQNEGTVPVGAIVMLSGSAVPDGWAAYTDANGRYILGAGGVADPGDTGGSATAGPFSGTTSSAGAHASPNDLPMPRVFSGASQSYRESNSAVGDHAHTWSISAFAPNLYRREQRLIVKTGSAAARFPVDAQIWGLPNLAGSFISKIIDRAGRYLLAAAANNSGGTQTPTVSAAVDGASDGHNHRSFSGMLDGTTVGSEPWSRMSNDGGGSHGHDAGSLAVTANLRRRQLCAFGGTAEFPIYPGSIIAWAGALDALPTDWVLCDGDNGTPDMRDYIVQFAGATPTAPAGDNSLSISGQTSEHGHSHDGGDLPAGQSGGSWAHSATVYHSHSISASTTWQPPWFALAFLMYAPGA